MDLFDPIPTCPFDHAHHNIPLNLSPVLVLPAQLQFQSLSLQVSSKRPLVTDSLPFQTLVLKYVLFQFNKQTDVAVHIPAREQ